MNIIETSHLSKSFGETKAVNSVSIHVKEKEIYGFLGLNGAGKTTAIRLMLGMIKPDSGEISLFGQKPHQASGIWNDVGYMVETPHAYPNLTVTENLKVITKLRGIKDRSQISYIIEKLQLSRYKDVREKNLSLGNKQRLGLAKALIHHPKLLILDEPINGLDPAGIVEIREFLKDLVDNYNTTIFLSSHILSEIARLATRIGIVHEGSLIKEVNSHELENQLIKKLFIQTDDNPKALKLLDDMGIKGEINQKSFIETQNPEALLSPEKVAVMLVNANIPPKHLQVFEEDLESYFLRMIGQNHENHESTVSSHQS